MAFLVEPGEINPSIRKEREKLFRHPLLSQVGCLVHSFNQSIPVRLFLQLGAIAINFFPSSLPSVEGVCIGKTGKFDLTNSHGIAARTWDGEQEQKCCHPFPFPFPFPFPVVFFSLSPGLLVWDSHP